MNSRKNWERDWHGRILLEHLTGQRFGHWTVVQLDKVHKTSGGNKNVKWICRCDCGTERSVSSNSLKRARSESCGCGISRVTCTTHGLTGTYIHRLWDGMKGRCLNPNNKDFRHYGLRGIKVCPLIQMSPQVVLDLIGDRPNPKMTIDRINNNGHYSCGKCRSCKDNDWPMNLRWATWVQQANNRRPSTRVY